MPEYRIAAERGAGPYIKATIADKRAGRIFVDMTGGTEGPDAVMEKLADNGVGTIVRHAHEPRPAQGRRGEPHPRGHRGAHLE